MLTSGREMVRLILFGSDADWLVACRGFLSSATQATVGLTSRVFSWITSPFRADPEPPAEPEPTQEDDEDAESDTEADVPPEEEEKQDDSKPVEDGKEEKVSFSVGFRSCWC